MQRSLADYNLAELEAQMAAWGFLRSHARRLLRAYYDSAGRPGFCTGTSLPLKLIERLADAAMTSEVAACQTAGDGTQKLLVRYPDGASVESVMMPDLRPDRAAGCLSSQVGCAMACDFCATGLQGFTRNLSAGEIVEQFLHLKHAAGQMGRMLHTVVFMGMGEPMLNLPNVIKAIHLMAEDWGGHLGWRQITVSTVGLIAPMRQFVSERLNVQLAVSLHAADEELRAKLIPSARSQPLKDVLDLAEEHYQNTGRVVIIQYCLLDGVNDSLDHARDLAALLDGRRMHVNLLTYNATGQTYRPSSAQKIAAFLRELRDRGVVAHLRRSRGSDIAAACGQLRVLAPRTR